MKTRIFLLSLVVGSLARQPSDLLERLKNRTEERRLANREFLSNMNKQTVELLQKNFKDVNWVERHDRLVQLGATQLGDMKKQSSGSLRPLLSKVKPIKIESPPNVNTSNLFELNQKTGVSSVLYQGDIMLTDEQLSYMEQTSKATGRRSKRQVSTVAPKWTNNRVFYFMDSSINARKRTVIAEAIKFLEERTCVRFIENANNPIRIKVFSGPGCFSAVGMSRGEQQLSLGNGCEVIGTVAHEFAHALGIWHTQMRSDRDQFVSIDLSAVTPGLESNFIKLPSSQVKSFTPYEYGSFMHYEATAFATRGRLTVIPRDEKFVFTMGNRMISFYDILMINEHYGCNARCPAASSARCQNGGIANPNNCAVCICPSGYDGALCDRRPSGCGEELAATTEWQRKQFEFGDNSIQTERDVFTLCNFWIKAPPGQKVQVRVTNMVNSQCRHGCPFQGIEFKTEADKRMTNPRVCCNEFNNNILTGELNPMPVVAWNRFLATSFTFEYRHVNADGTNPGPGTQTTAKPAGSANCVDKQLICAQLANGGFCSSTSQPFDVRKVNCAKTCGLCGVAAEPCNDRAGPRCPQLSRVGFCTRDPLIGEFHCASTCGYCQNPI